jgi:uncharacterized membrane-anchored protein YjiN (DUF445 family)
MIHAFAACLLLFSTIGFVITSFVSTPFWGRDLLRVFFEASLVGGLADWFAITALFAHPFSIPIPHTAIIQTNKERIARSIAHFIGNNILVKELLASSSIMPHKLISKWIEDGRQTKVSKGPPLIDEAVIERILALGGNSLESLPMRSVLIGILLTIERTSLHEEVATKLFHTIRGFLSVHRQWFLTQIGEVRPWYIPSFLDRKLGESIIDYINETLERAERESDHEVRALLHDSVRKAIERLQLAPEVKENDESEHRWDLFLRQLLSRLVQSSELRESVRNHSEGGSLNDVVNKLLVEMLSDEKLGSTFDAILINSLGTLLETKRDTIVNSIFTLINSWDASLLVGRFRAQVYDDLQYIRINGTLIGGLVGVALYLIRDHGVPYIKSLL